MPEAGLPQTYEEWRQTDAGRDAGMVRMRDGDLSWSQDLSERAVFEAGRASRQAEVDRLRRAVGSALLDEPEWWVTCLEALGDA